MLMSSTHGLTLSSGHHQGSAVHIATRGHQSSSGLPSVPCAMNVSCVASLAGTLSESQDGWWCRSRGISAKRHVGQHWRLGVGVATIGSGNGIRRSTGLPNGGIKMASMPLPRSGKPVRVRSDHKAELRGSQRGRPYAAGGAMLLRLSEGLFAVLWGAGCNRENSVGRGNAGLGFAEDWPQGSQSELVVTHEARGLFGRLNRRRIHLGQRRRTSQTK